MIGGGASVANGWVAPAVAGYRAGACGAACTYNPTAAKALYAQVTHPGVITISVNGDGGADVKAAPTEICADIRRVLATDCRVTIVPTRTS